MTVETKEYGTCGTRPSVKGGYYIERLGTDWIGISDSRGYIVAGFQNDWDQAQKQAEKLCNELNGVEP